MGTRTRAGDRDLIAAHDDDLLPAEKLLGDDRRQPAEHVRPAIHENSIVKNHGDDDDGTAAAIGRRREGVISPLKFRIKFRKV